MKATTSHSLELGAAGDSWLHAYAQAHKNTLPCNAGVAAACSPIYPDAGLSSPDERAHAVSDFTDLIGTPAVGHVDVSTCPPPLPATTTTRP